MTDVRDIAIMRREIEAIPEILERQIDTLGPEVGDLLDRLRGIGSDARQCVITGCGDSYFAGIGSRLIFDRYAGIACEPIEAMEFARYELNDRTWHDGARLLIAVSYSGEVGRTIEAVVSARAQGWQTIALTGRFEGRLADVADETLILDVPTLGTTPGTSTYVSMLMALGLLAAQLAGVRGRSEARQALMLALQAVPELAERTLRLSASPSEAFAAALTDASLPVFLGAGPSIATANFGAAKILESTQRPAVAGHLEEWAHGQYFASGPTTPTTIVAPVGPSLSRAAELLSEMQYIETPCVLVTDRGENPATEALEMPFAPGAPEALTPLLSCLPLAYGVALLAAQLGTRSYGFRSSEHEQEHYETIHRFEMADGD